MTDLQRKNVKIFAVNSGAQGTSEFGSLKSTGSFAFSQDINDLQTSEYETGWRGAVVNGKTPTIPDFNTISRVISEQVAYLYQKGMAEWSIEQTYFIGNKCMIINNGVPQEYYSLTDNNIGNNPLNDTINWKNINDLIFENISNSYVVLDGSNATFTNLQAPAKENIQNCLQVDLDNPITVSNGMTIEQNGILYFRTGTLGECQIYINGVMVYRVNVSSGSVAVGGFLLLFKGDVLTFNNLDLNSTTRFYYFK